MAKTRSIVLVLDELDYKAIKDELKLRDARPLPGGESNKAGAKIAEMVRDIREYRELSAKPRDTPSRAITIHQPN